MEDRRAWDKDLLRFYLDRLHAAGAQPPFFDEAWLAYRRNSLYGYFCWLSTIPGSAKGNAPEMEPKQVSLDIIHRTANAIHDLDSFAAMTQ